MVLVQWIVQPGAILRIFLHGRDNLRQSLFFAREAPLSSAIVANLAARQSFSAHNPKKLLRDTNRLDEPRESVFEDCDLGDAAANLAVFASASAPCQRLPSI
jgi:hypothetical protein